MSVPKNLLTPLPDNVDFESAAFTTLTAIALHGFRLAQIQLGERVAVIGLGLLGLLAVQIARSAGCAVFGIDLDARRVALAQQLGATAVLRSQAVDMVHGFSRGRGCDAVLICADTPSDDPVILAGSLARDRARVVAIGAVGLQLPRKIYYEKELTFLNSRSYGPGRYDPVYEEGGQDYPIGYVRWTENRNLEACVDLFACGTIDIHPLITHRFAIEQASQAYDLITGKMTEPFLGVLLTYPGNDSQISELNAGRPTVNVQRSTFTVNPAHLEAVKLGMLGAGNFASNVMLPAIKGLPGLELVGIASASGASAQHAAQRFNFQYAASDEARILDDPQINTVAIMTRHNLHAHQVLAALQAGKHVFCEKPLAVSDKELNAIEALLKLPGDPASLNPLPYLMVGFNRRFAPLAQHLREFLQERAEPLVMHYRINAGYIPLTHWVQDPQQGGRLIGEGCHFLDFLTFLVGAPPLSVNSQGLPDGGRYQEDNLVMTFAFADGSIGTVSYLSNGDRAFPKERVEVFCGGRVAVLDDFRSLETVREGKRQVNRSRLRQDKGHTAEWRAFIQALQTGGPPPIPYEHLLGVTRATFAAIRALRSGQRTEIPVNFP